MGAVFGSSEPEFVDAFVLAASEQILSEAGVLEDALEIDDRRGCTVGLHEQLKGLTEIEFEHRSEGLRYVCPQRILEQANETVDRGRAFNGRIATEPGEHIHGEVMCWITQMREHNIALPMRRHAGSDGLPKVAMRVKQN